MRDQALGLEGGVQTVVGARLGRSTCTCTAPPLHHMPCSSLTPHALEHLLLHLLFPDLGCLPLAISTRQTPPVNLQGPAQASETPVHTLPSWPPPSSRLCACAHLQGPWFPGGQCLIPSTCPHASPIGVPIPRLTEQMGSFIHVNKYLVSIHYMPGASDIGCSAMNEMDSHPCLYGREAGDT